MARLTFIKSEIQAVIAAAKAHRNPINLVGDEGVYFSTTTHHGTPPVCAYAIGCNPLEAAVDDWLALKRQTFGADDGVEQMELATLQVWVRHTAGNILVMQINQHSVVPIDDNKAPVQAIPRSSPDMLVVSNDDRAARAQEALAFYAAKKGQTLHWSSAQIADLVADLLHLAAFRGAGPKEIDGIVRLARLHHQAEHDDPDERGGAKHRATA